VYASARKVLCWAQSRRPHTCGSRRGWGPRGRTPGACTPPGRSTAGTATEQRKRGEGGLSTQKGQRQKLVLAPLLVEVRLALHPIEQEGRKGRSWLKGGGMATEEDTERNEGRKEERPNAREKHRKGRKLVEGGWHWQQRKTPNKEGERRRDRTHEKHRKGRNWCWERFRSSRAGFAVTVPRQSP